MRVISILFNRITSTNEQPITNVSPHKQSNVTCEVIENAKRRKESNILAKAFISVIMKLSAISRKGIKNKHGFSNQCRK